MTPSVTLLEHVRASVTLPSGPPPEPPDGHKRASVLLLLDPSTPRLPLLFMLRSADLRFHPGQIGFPGGTAEPDDSDVVTTALRESAEELGVDPDNVEVIGMLTPLVTATSDRWLTPVIGLEKTPWQVRPDSYEVAEWFRIDLAQLMIAPHTIRQFERNGVSHDVHFYDVEGRVIWGVTGAILHELLGRLERTD